MDNPVVLDASALMAMMRGETGGDRVTDCMDRAVISSVNLAEVQTKLVDAGMGDQDAWRHIDEAGCISVPFDDEQARLAGSLVRITRPFGQPAPAAMSSHAESATINRSLGPAAVNDGALVLIVQTHPGDVARIRGLLGRHLIGEEHV